MSFDIRDFNREENKPQQAKHDCAHWTQTFLKQIDSRFPEINKECNNLNIYSTPKSAKAFQAKQAAWYEFVIAVQKLCQLYKVYNAQCLSRKN